MAKQFDIPLLNNTIVTVVKDAFQQMCHVDPLSEPLIAEREIIEYDGRMRVSPMEKFNGPAYVAAVVFYLSEKDQKDNLAIGNFVFFLKEEFLEKILKALGQAKVDVDNDELVLEKIGEFVKVLAENLAKEMESNGYSSLIVTSPVMYKNVVPEGVPFDYNLFKKQEFTFSFWNKNTVVIESCMGWIPKKAR